MSLYLASLPWAAIIWPCVSLFLVEGLIVFIRWFGKFETSAEAVGSDLNLITFGFAVQQIAREGDQWVLHGVAPSGGIAFGVSGTGAGQGSGALAPTVFDTGALDCRLEI